MNSLKDSRSEGGMTLPINVDEVAILSDVQISAAVICEVGGQSDPKLTDTEKRVLAFQEKRIESGRSAFIAVAEALLIIRDRRLYRETHITFDEYCRERWAFAKNYANKLIASAAAVNRLPMELGTIVPNEAIAREIAKVEPERREEVVREAAESAKANGRPLVARDISESRMTGDKTEQERNRQHLTKLKKLWASADSIVRSEFRQWACLAEK